MVKGLVVTGIALGAGFVVMQALGGFIGVGAGIIVFAVILAKGM